MDGDLAVTYTFIHAFLTKHSHKKAAQAVKRAAREVVVLKDDIDLEGPRLDEIIKEWTLNSQKKATASSSSGSDSSSDSTSDADSSSSSSSASGVETSKRKQLKKAAKAKTKSSKSNSSSSSDTDVPPPKPIVAKKISKKSSPSPESGSESDDESSDSSPPSNKAKEGSKKELSKPTISTAAKKVERDSSRTLSSHPGSELEQESIKVAKPAKKSSSQSSSSSDSSEVEKAKKISTKKMDSSSSSESDPDSDGPSPITKETAATGTKVKAGQNSDSSDSDSSSDEDVKPLVPSLQESVNSESVVEGQATKKRRTNLEGTSVVTATTNTPQEEGPRGQSSARLKVNTKAGRPVGERFQRVDPARVEPLMDNGYVAKHAPTNDYGKRAHEDLIVTRGAGFRKEKNKKKKGSYRGGAITMQSHSFKFT